MSSGKARGIDRRGKLRPGIGEGIKARLKLRHARRRLESRLGVAGTVGGTTPKGRGRGQA